MAGKDTPLHTALKNDELEKAQAFIQQGQYIHTHGEKGLTSLHIAVVRGQIDIIKALLNQGAKIEAKDEDGWTPLHFIAHIGNVDIAEILFSKNPDPDVKNNNGQTPLHVASFLGRPKMVEYLIKKGAFVNVETNLDKKIIWRNIPILWIVLAIPLWWVGLLSFKFFSASVLLAIIVIWFIRPANSFSMAKALEKKKASTEFSFFSSASPASSQKSKTPFLVGKIFFTLTPLDSAHSGMEQAEGLVENHEEVIEILKKNGAKVGYFKFESIFKRSEKPKGGEGKNKALLFGRLRRG